jgi:hypothetical protein
MGSGGEGRKRRGGEARGEGWMGDNEGKEWRKVVEGMGVDTQALHSHR